MADKRLDALAARLLKEKKNKDFVLDKVLFDKQLDFINSEADTKIVLCSRRAGKSYAIAAHLVSLCMSIRHISVLYISLTAKVAKNIILPIITPMVEYYDLPCRVEEHAGRIKFNNGSEIQLHGVKDATEINKFRGMAPYTVVIDEAGHFNSYLDELVAEVIQPMLMDHDATLILAGTPPRRNTGVFYESFKRGMESPSSELKSFHWTFFDNPGLPAVVSGKNTHQGLFNKVLKKSGLSENDPVIRREYFGECVEDLDGIVFKTTIENIIEDFEHDTKMRYILGVDTGSGGENDASGYAVLAYIPGRNDVWVVEAFEDDTEGFSSKVEIVRELAEKYGGFETVVIDPAASGKDLVNELHLRYRFHAQSASKMKKEQFIEFMGDDIRTNRLKIYKPLCQTLLFQWDFISWARKKDGTRQINSVIKGVKQDHVSDACLYAWRECQTYIKEKTEEKLPEMGSKEWFFYQLKRQEERQEGAKRASRLARMFRSSAKRKLNINF